MVLKRILATGIVSYLCSGIALADDKVDQKISATTDEIEAGYSAVYYGGEDEDPWLVGIDGSAATGGFRTWSFADDGDNLTQLTSNTPGRTEVIDVLYGVAGKDLLVSIADPDSLLRLFDAKDPSGTSLADKKVLGGWSSLCSWRSPESGWQYFYLFGKKEAVQFVVREQGGQLEILEVSSDFPYKDSANKMLKNNIGPNFRHPARAKLLRCIPC
jgi:3-phytase